MAADITEITYRGQEIPESDHDLLAHILTDLHEALRELHRQGQIQARHDAMLREYQPLIARFRSPLASALPGGKRHRG